MGTVQRLLRYAIGGALRITFGGWVRAVSSVAVIALGLFGHTWIVQHYPGARSVLGDPVSRLAAKAVYGGVALAAYFLLVGAVRLAIYPLVAFRDIRRQRDETAHLLETRDAELRELKTPRLVFRFGSSESYHHDLGNGRSLLRILVRNDSAVTVDHVEVFLRQVSPPAPNLGLPLPLHRMHANEEGATNVPFTLPPYTEVFIDFAYLAPNRSAVWHLEAQIAHTVAGIGVRALPLSPGKSHQVTLLASGRAIAPASCTGLLSLVTGPDGRGRLRLDPAPSSAEPSASSSPSAS